MAFDFWPLRGPRTMLWVARFFQRRGTQPNDHHRWWVSTAHLAPTDWGVVEHSNCCWLLELGGSFDQLDLPNIAMCEAAARRLQAIEWQYRERVREGARGHVSASSSLSGAVAMSADEFDLFEGGDEVNVTLCAAPALIRFVADESKKEADVSKAGRTAREEKLMAQTDMSFDDMVAQVLGKSGGGGGGAGSGDAAADGTGGGGGGRRRRRRRQAPRHHSSCWRVARPRHVALRLGSVSRNTNDGRWLSRCASFPAAVCSSPAWLRRRCRGAQGSLPSVHQFGQ